MISGTDVVADNRSYGNSDSHIKGDEEVVDVHDDCDCRNSVFSKKFHDDKVK